MSPNNETGPFKVIRDAEGNDSGLRQELGPSAAIFDPNDIDAETGRPKALSQRQVNSRLKVEEVEPAPVAAGDPQQTTGNEQVVELDPERVQAEPSKGGKK